MTDGQVLDRAVKARAVLDSPAYQDAYAAVRQRLLDAMLAVKIEDSASAEDFRRCIKLLDALKAELDTAINSGKLAEANIAEIEARRKNPLRGIFR
jgi:soluble cytochrome b562